MAWVNTLPTPTGSSSSSTHAPARRSQISHLLGLFAGYSLPVAHPILSSTLPRFYRSLPIVDVGAHTGGDLIVPAALRGHRVYAYEPTPRTFHALVGNLRRSNISFATKPRGFRNATAGTVLVRHAAVSDRSGFATLLQSPVYGGVANTLGGDAAMPASYLQGAYRRNVSTVRLDDELKEEVDGVFMLKIDSQGHEMSVLRARCDELEVHEVRGGVNVNELEEPVLSQQRRAVRSAARTRATWREAAVDAAVDAQARGASHCSHAEVGSPVPLPERGARTHARVCQLHQRSAAAFAAS